MSSSRAGSQAPTGTRRKVLTRSAIRALSQHEREEYEASIVQSSLKITQNRTAPAAAAAAVTEPTRRRQRSPEKKVADEKIKPEVKSEAVVVADVEESIENEDAGPDLGMQFYHQMQMASHRNAGGASRKTIKKTKEAPAAPSSESEGKPTAAPTHQHAFATATQVLRGVKLTVSPLLKEVDDTGIAAAARRDFIKRELGETRLQEWADVVVGGSIDDDVHDDDVHENVDDDADINCARTGRDGIVRSVATMELFRSLMHAEQ